MTTLDESVSVAYKSSAVSHAAAQTKYNIANTTLAAERVLKHSLLPDRESVAFQQNQNRIALWGNYRAAHSYHMRLYTYANIGVKHRLEALWVQMGNAIVDLPDWDTYANRDLKTVISFTNFAGGVNLAGVEGTEDVFTGNSSEIPTTDFETQFEEMFDLFINDIWASEGMRYWTRDELNRGPESAADLAEWDSINDDAGGFFVNAMHCCVKLANNFSQYEAGGPNEASFINKYQYGPTNRYNAVNGLFALDPDDLPSQQYRARVENKNVTYR